MNLTRLILRSRFPLGTASARETEKPSAMITLISHSPQALAAIVSAAPQFVTTLVTATVVAGVYFAVLSGGEPEDPSDL